MTQKDQALKAIDDSGVRAGQTWRHHKGGRYTVIAVGIEEATLIPQVIYAGGDGVVWVRRLVVFLESVEDTVPRFKLEEAERPRSWRPTDGFEQLPGASS